MIISKDIPAGNIRLLSISGNKVELDLEMRDSEGQWFYWCFKAKFPTPGTYDFHFINPNVIGPRGPALSADGGKTWKWLGADARSSSQDFSYRHDGKSPELIFCVGMQYLQRDFELFRSEFAKNSALKVGELCKSPKGRSVELVTIREGKPRYKLFLCSRHHCCEMMATHALEGILRAALADDELGKKFRGKIAICAVPFVDKDGVEDGDQGKNRLPRDHARDYAGDSIYPETKAIKELIAVEKPDFVLDMHCPWISGGDSNETIYIPGCESPRLAKALDIFSGILEQEAPRSAPYFKRNNIPFGTGWNTGSNYTKGAPIKYWAGQQPFVLNAQTIEIPYANCQDVTLGHQAMMDFGRALAKSVLLYFEKVETEGR